MTNTFNLRDIVWIDFPIHDPKGREQQGRRPAVVVALPSNTGSTRFSLIIVVPITRQTGEWVAQNTTLYPSLPGGVGNLTHNSVVLLDQICAVDTRRVFSYLGTLTVEEYQPIADGLKAMFGF